MKLCKMTTTPRWDSGVSLYDTCYVNMTFTYSIERQKLANTHDEVCVSSRSIELYRINKELMNKYLVYKTFMDVAL